MPGCRRPLIPATVAALRKWKTQQNVERLKWGAAWTDSGKVFTNEAGLPLHPDRVSKSWNKAVTAVDVPRMRLHDLRHGFATMHISAGTQAKHLQSLLGHSTIGVTLDCYVHPGDDDLAAAQAGFGAALAGKS
jgi:integrase